MYDREWALEVLRAELVYVKSQLEGSRRSPSDIVELTWRHRKDVIEDEIARLEAAW